MNINDYSKTKLESADKDEQKLEEIKNDYGFLVDEFLKRYGKMSEKQMMDEMFKLVKEKKEDGSFDITQIEKAANNIKPFLGAYEQQYMEDLIKKLK